MKVRWNRVVSTAREVLAWAFGRRVPVVVGGDSMVPTLEPGWRVLVDPAQRGREGDVVVARDPHDPGRYVVKRRGEADGARVILRSDNPTHSPPDYAVVDVASVLGRVTYVLDQRQPPGPRARAEAVSGYRR